MRVAFGFLGGFWSEVLGRFYNKEAKVSCKHWLKRPCNPKTSGRGLPVAPRLFCGPGRGFSLPQIDVQEADDVCVWNGVAHMAIWGWKNRASVRRCACVSRENKSMGGWSRSCRISCTQIRIYFKPPQANTTALRTSVLTGARGNARLPSALWISSVSSCSRVRLCALFIPPHYNS